MRIGEVMVTRKTRHMSSKASRPWTTAWGSIATLGIWLAGIGWTATTGEAQAPARPWQYLAADSRVGPRARLRDCRKSAERIGVLNATGDVQFVISSDGRPDTSSVMVVATSGASPLGFRSAARRYLGSCRFSAALVNRHPVSVLGLGRIILARDSMVLMTARGPADSMLTDALPRGEPEPGRIYENADPEVDEKPRLMPCGRNWGTFTVPEGADALATISGSALLEFVIGTNGRADGATARILSTDNQLVARELLTSYMGCRYVPGRVLGEPVPVRVRVGDRR